MNKKNLSKLAMSALLCVGLGGAAAHAQELGQAESNEYSLRPIRNADILFKQSVWYRIDLRQKMNEGFFSKNNEISKIIIDAVRMGVIRPYMNDSLNQRMSPQMFSENMKIPGAGDATDDPFFGGGGWDDGGGGGGWGDDGGGGGGGGWGDESSSSAAAAPAEFFADQIFILELKEDVLFDKKRSRLYHDLQTVTLILPSDNNPLGVDKPIATFSYKELVENVFVDNKDAIYFNAKNQSGNMNLADAFEQRLWDGRIYKFANAKDGIVVDIYTNPTVALWKALEYEHDLLDYESTLWSY